MMKPVHVRDILRFMDQWAPPGVKLDYDNVGLLAGDGNRPVNGILVSLDTTEEIVDEAVETGADLIVSHHPLLFKPLRSITPDTATGRILSRLLTENISLIAAHTNLDAALDGVSFALANEIGLDDLSFLEAGYAIRRKIRLTTTHTDGDEILRLLNYHSGEEAHYWELDGKKGRLKCFEAVLDHHHVRPLMAALEKANLLRGGTLQEVALQNPTGNFGMGVVGTYPSPGIAPEEFLHLIGRTLRTPAIRHSGRPERIRNVAVCGGAGASLIPKAVRAGVDAYVTSDLKYHDFFHDSESTMLVDVGHYESEFPIVDVIRNELAQAFETVPVRSTQRVTNPIRTFISTVSSPHEAGGST